MIFLNLVVENQALEVVGCGLLKLNGLVIDWPQIKNGKGNLMPPEITVDSESFLSQQKMRSGSDNQELETYLCLFSLLEAPKPEKILEYTNMSFLDPNMRSEPA
jgi:hypothetical protein